MRTFAIAVAATLALPILSAEAATEITWWHAMEADLGQKEVSDVPHRWDDRSRQ